MKNVILIDGNALMHRSYHGVQNGFIPMYEGMPIGMVFGFASMMVSLISYLRPDVLVVAFDTKEKTFRHEMDAEYKAQRVAAPDDFYPQIPYIYELLESFEIPILKLQGFESDDIVGTMAVRAEDQGFSVTIVSSDFDFLQLVSDHIHLLKLDGSIEKSPEFGPTETFQKYGVTPVQVVDFKSITGDASDNYKGIAGVGPKTAMKLLQQYQTLEGIYDHLDDLEGKLKEKFISSKEYLFHCRILAEIHKHVPLAFSFSDHPFHLAFDSAQHFLEKMKFFSVLQRYKKLNNKSVQQKSGEQKKESFGASADEQMVLF